jgi:hypothetical protein
MYSYVPQVKTQAGQGQVTNTYNVGLKQDNSIWVQKVGSNEWTTETATFRSIDIKNAWKVWKKSNKSSLVFPAEHVQQVVKRKGRPPSVSSRR